MTTTESWLAPDACERDTCPMRAFRHRHRADGTPEPAVADDPATLADDHAQRLTNERVELRSLLSNTKCIRNDRGRWIKPSGAEAERILAALAAAGALAPASSDAGDVPELWWSASWMAKTGRTRSGGLIVRAPSGQLHGQGPEAVWTSVGLQDGLPADAVRLTATPPAPKGGARTVRPAFGDPEARFEWRDEDDQGHDAAVGWDLAFGCQVSIGYDGGSLRAVVAMSDASGRGHEVRAVTEEQVRAYGSRLLALVSSAPAETEAFAEVDAPPADTRPDAVLATALGRVGAAATVDEALSLCGRVTRELDRFDMVVAARPDLAINVPGTGTSAADRRRVYAAVRDLLNEDDHGLPTGSSDSVIRLISKAMRRALHEPAATPRAEGAVAAAVRDLVDSPAAHQAVLGAFTYAARPGVADDPRSVGWWVARAILDLPTAHRCAPLAPEGEAACTRTTTPTSLLDGWPDGLLVVDCDVHGEIAMVRAGDLGDGDFEYDRVDRLWRQHVGSPSPAGPQSESEAVTTAEVGAWDRERFGNRGVIRIALKLAEETGEVAGAVVKRDESAVRPAKGLVTREDWTRHLHDELGDVGIALHALCAREGTTLDEVVTRRFRDDVALRTGQEAPAAGEQCPTCTAHRPELHPAVQEGGEVQLCPDLFHATVTPENPPERVEAVAADLSRYYPDRDGWWPPAPGTPAEVAGGER